MATVKNNSDLTELIQESHLTNKQQQQQKPWEGRNLISRVAILYDFKCPIFNISYKTYKETGKLGPYKGEKTAETVPQEEQILNLLDEDFKSYIINMFK